MTLSDLGLHQTNDIWLAINAKLHRFLICLWCEDDDENSLPIHFSVLNSGSFLNIFIVAVVNISALKIHHTA